MKPRHSCPWLIGLLMFQLCAASSFAQPSNPPNPIKKIFVAAFTGKLGDDPELRQQIIHSLHKNSTFQVVSDQTQADAVLKGTGELWIRGYISVSPRATNQYPVYGGYLSGQLIDKNGETLWSYLVTPNRSSSNIVQDLAQQLVSKMSVVHEETSAQQASSQSSQHPSITLKVGGATFPAPLYQTWFNSFQQRHAGISIHYDPIGSEAGIEQLRAGKVIFAASDVPLSPAKMAEMPSPVLQFVSVLGAVVPIYNLPNVGSDLRFTPEVLAGIFLGKIHRWNDPKIVAINHHVSLPDHEITVVHRSDGSGTTSAFTDFLTKTNPEWKTEIGTGFAVHWPVGKGEQGNNGVASAVASIPDSIGYAELSYAIQRHLSYGTVRNSSGNFVQANLISLAAAANTPGGSPAILTNSPAKDAYPITAFTWLLVPKSIPDPVTKSAVADFLEWMLTSGQKECSALAYTPLPKAVVNRQLGLLAEFKSK